MSRLDAALPATDDQAKRAQSQPINQVPALMGEHPHSLASSRMAGRRIGNPDPPATFHVLSSRHPHAILSAGSRFRVPFAQSHCQKEPA